MSKRGWLLSSLLHGAFVAAAILGLPNLFESEPLDASDRPIVVSVVQLSDEASAPEPEPPPQPEPLPIAEPEPEPVPKAPPEPELAALPPEPEPAPPTPEPEPESVAEPEPEPLPEPVQAPPPPEAVPAAKLAPEPQPQAPPTPPARPVAKTPSFGSLLKDLSREEPDPPVVPPSAEKPEEDESFGDLLKDIALADSEETAATPSRSLLDGPWRSAIADAIRQKVEKNWSVPAGVADAETLVVTLRIRLERDGSVRDVAIVDSGRGDDGAFRIMAESAQRAVLKADPFEALKAYTESYDEWGEITMKFKPPV